MQKLSLEKYKDFTNRNELKYFPLINSVLSGQQNGNIYIDNNWDPGIIFIINKYGFSYLWVKNSIENSNELFDFFLNNRELPEYFHIYDFPEAIVRLIQDNKNSFSYKIRDRVQLRWDENVKLNHADKNEFDCEIRQIDAISFNCLNIFNLNIENRFWNSKNDFLENGYGVVIFCDGSPVSVCYSACVVDGISEIDVATMKEYRGKGFGKMATIEFIKESLRRNIKPNWDCFKENEPSLRLALNLGFKIIKNYKFLSVYKN